jgi:hypothetical protein
MDDSPDARKNFFLKGPACGDRDSANIPLHHARPPSIRTIQKQNLILFPLWQVQDVHNLGNPGTRNSTEPRQIGVIFDHAIEEQAVEVDGECHGWCPKFFALLFAWLRGGGIVVFLLFVVASLSVPPLTLGIKVMQPL